MCCFFFFKQKTAYEMRISDWSSDVCSSDLFDRDIHADEAGDARQDGADDEAGRRNRAEEQADENGDDDADDGDGAILAAQIGLGAFLDGSGNLDRKSTRLNSSH